MCEDHFKVCDFVNATKTRLKSNAVPIAYRAIDNEEPELKVLIPTRTYSRKPMPMFLEDFRESSDSDECDATELEKILNLSPSKVTYSPNRARLQKKMSGLRKLLKKRRDQINFLRKKIIVQKFTAVSFNRIMLSSHSATFVKMLLKERRRGKYMWTKAEKDLSLNLYLKSPGTYKHMRNVLNFNLPHVSSIKRWLSIYRLNTGFDANVREKLKLKLNTMVEADKQCVLLMDEMTIKSSLEYNSVQDVVEGFEDIGSLGRYPYVGKQALVFMIRGLFTKWKFPISYFIYSTSMKAAILRHLLKEVLEELQKLGLNVRAVVCDQGGNNRKVFTDLGATDKMPFFHLGEKKIYAIFDVPHLIKSIRNTLLKQDVIVDGKRISWEDIVAVYRLDKCGEKARALVKITDQHIYPNNFEKMRVRYATQIFSHSVATAIQTAVQLEQVKSGTALDTSKFILKMNYLFDCLNSKLLFDGTPLRSALSIYRDSGEKYLKSTINWIESWSILETQQRRCTKVYCFQGMVQSVRATLQLWDDVKKDGYKFLLTNRLNQDPIENLFSVVRRHGGNCINPTVRGFRMALQTIMATRLQTPVELSNCEFDEDQAISIQMESTHIDSTELDEEMEPEATIETSENLITTEESEDVLAPLPCTSSTIQARTTLQLCSTTYFAGYLFYKLNNKYNCASCTELLTQDSDLKDKKQLLILNRDFGVQDTASYLKTPSEYLIKIVDVCLETFRIHFENCKAKKGVRKILYDYISKDLERENFLIENSCREHRLYLVDQLLKCKLLKTLKWMSSDLKNPTEIKRRKITILKNK